MYKVILILILNLTKLFIVAQVPYLVQVNTLPDNIHFDKLLNAKWDRKISSIANIYKINIYNKELSHHQIKNILYNTHGIVNVQKDRKLQARSIVTPNDSLYYLQYYHNNIKTPMVWNNIAHGLNAKGDTLVIAIIDDGVDTAHPDLQGNLWINYNEIPYNGIDDDANGYTDDYRGWNTLDTGARTCVVSSNERAKHGTTLAGVVGAVGNNLIGISGVNWKIKIMPVVGGNGSESNAIEAYEYVAKMRRLYNETNGQKGAYIIATNISWGVGGDFENDAPLWCAYYDTLGKLGILNFGATDNIAVDVDVMGDLPSTCSSKHLIVVTSSNDNDTKTATAAFGKVNVDIAVPGNNILSTSAIGYGSNLGNYIYTNGTSLSSPICAASVGLLYTNACEQFINFSKTNPDSANLLLRNFILSSVDTFVDFVNTTSSQGRLNISKALIKLNQWCANSSVNNLSNSNFLTIYPNPNNGKFTIESTEIGTVKIFNAIGKEIYNTWILKGTNNIENVHTTGMYIVQISLVNGITSNSKILVE